MSEARTKSKEASGKPKKNSPVAEKKDISKPPNKVHYEFGGPFGSTGIIIGLPFVLYLLYFTCNSQICLRNPFEFSWSSAFEIIGKSNFFSIEALHGYLIWMIFHIVLERILPCEIVEGVELEDGRKTKLKYNMNGHLQFWITMLSMFHLIPIFKDSSFSSLDIIGFRPLLPINSIYDNYLAFVTISIIGSYLLSIYLYLSSFVPGKLLAKGGNTGYHIYDFFIGRELNPRIGSFDLKEFCELRPGLMGWLALNLGMAWKQYQLRGSVSGSMAMVVLFQGIYVWDALYQEKSILTTMDITTDGFGFMLAFGDLSWVPIVYSLQARYLVDHDPSLPPATLAAIAALHWLGFYIFRAANSQKDAFRKDPNGTEVRGLRFMNTKRGTKLLVSGWWGLARKINYTGDFLITLSWCLLCGFASPIPYFQAVYFAILLVHRAVRDDEMFFEKYGEDWLEYKKRVPYMFIPYVF